MVTLLIILSVIGILTLCAFIMAVPVFLIINFVCWVFHSPFYINILQAFAIALLATLIHNLLFKQDKGGKD